MRALSAGASRLCGSVRGSWHEKSMQPLGLSSACGVRTAGRLLVGWRVILAFASTPRGGASAGAGGGACGRTDGRLRMTNASSMLLSCRRSDSPYHAWRRSCESQGRPS